MVWFVRIAGIPNATWKTKIIYALISSGSNFINDFFHNIINGKSFLPDLVYAKHKKISFFEAQVIKIFQ